MPHKRLWLRLKTDAPLIPVTVENSWRKYCAARCRRKGSDDGPTSEAWRRQIANCDVRRVNDGFLFQRAEDREPVPGSAGAYGPLPQRVRAPADGSGAGGAGGLSGGLVGLIRGLVGDTAKPMAKPRRWVKPEPTSNAAEDIPP